MYLLAPQSSVFYSETGLRSKPSYQLASDVLLRLPKVSFHILRQPHKFFLPDHCTLYGAQTGEAYPVLSSIAVLHA